MDRLPVLILKKDTRKGSARRGPAPVGYTTGAAEQQIALGVVYFPDIPDTQGDFASEEEVREMAYRFMRASNMHAIDVEHDGYCTVCYVVESFIVREGDPDFPVPGSWVVGIHIPDDMLWAKVKSGELNGFSLEAMAKTFPGEVPLKSTFKKGVTLKGRTAKSYGHDHSFTVELDADGKIISGSTSVHTDPDTGMKHSHDLTRWSRTGEADGHLHRYSILDYAIKETA